MAGILALGLSLQSCSDSLIPIEEKNRSTSSMKPAKQALVNKQETTINLISSAYLVPAHESITPATDLFVNKTDNNKGIIQNNKAAIQKKDKKEVTEITVRTKQGYKIKFYQEASIWKAKVREKIGSLSRNLKLPVYHQGLDLANLWHTYSIHVEIPKQAKDGKGYV
ncbi:hypothetical protein GR268_43540, partial [Rhizobium leguminosarum]|nr:hypothetical protein [Rhizobium leguminosarum]